jgi:hypothetical protein
MKTGSNRYYICKLDDETFARIPQWMSNFSLCHNIKIVETPSVSVSSLLELKLLLKK